MNEKIKKCNSRELSGSQDVGSYLDKRIAAVFCRPNDKKKIYTAKIGGVIIFQLTYKVAIRRYSRVTVLFFFGNEVELNISNLVLIA